MTELPNKPVRAGGCKCGLVRFQAWGEPQRVGVCHCESCRRATGGAFAIYADYPPGSVAFEGMPAIWSSQPGVERLFCPRCGSPIAFREEDEPPLTAVFLGAFDAPRDLSPHHATHEEEGFDWALDALASLMRKDAM